MKLMSTHNHDKIIHLAGQGIAQIVIAEACGVSPSYVSQVLELPESQQAVALARSKKLDAAVEMDSRLESVEMKALKMVENKLPFVRNAAEAAKVFQTLNAAKRRTAPGGNDVAGGVQQVTLILPAAARLMFKVNETNQVIEVEGRSMAPLPSKALAGLAANKSPAPQDVAAKAIPEISHTESEYRQRIEESDKVRAGRILQDLETHINGVRVVL